MYTNQSCDRCIIFSKSVFANIDKKDIKILSEKKKCSSFKKGQSVIRANTNPIGIYCVNKGKLKVFKYGVMGKEYVFRFVSPGELIGMKALFCNKNYTTNIVAVEDSNLCLIYKNDFLNILSKYPSVEFKIITALCERLEEVDNKITSLAQKSVRERLAEELITLNNIFNKEKNVDSNTAEDADSNTLSFSREELANIVGTSKETITRFLSEFKNDKLLSIKGRKITILNIKGLKKIGSIFK
ncbi:MAG: Crp/Fnr family transcriptional regulator [Bacteroidota bacterium]